MFPEDRSFPIFQQPRNVLQKAFVYYAECMYFAVWEGILHYQIMANDGRLCIIDFLMRLKLLMEVEIPCRLPEEPIYKYDQPSHQRHAAAVPAVDYCLSRLSV